MDSETWRPRSTLIALIAVVIANILIILTFHKYPNLSPIKLLHWDVQEQNNSNPDDERNYEDMIARYHARIASIPQHKYRSVLSHTDIGPPVSSLFNVSEKLSSHPKLILIWTTFFGIKDWLYDSVFDKCQGPPCHVTTDKSDLLRSHAVIMHPRDMPAGRKNLPPTRLPWQRWIYFLKESPFHTGIRVSDFINIFNWTATYRLDSDIPVRYGVFERRETPLKPQSLGVLVSNIMKTKTKLVASRISNCDRSKTGRLNYIAELKKYIAVDFYGKCGDQQFRSLEAGDEILKQYKFYLAFENSNCRDYITEKFAKSLTVSSSVPIVMGAAPEDYKAFAPDQSYIHTAGFESPKHLAEYLLLLDRNNYLYERYFTWHTFWIPVMGGMNARSKTFCKMCSDLHNLSLPIMSYRDFGGWYKEDFCP